MFLSLDGTFWIQLINFGIFFFLLNAVFLRPVVAALQERRAYIDGVASDYDRFRSQIVKIDDETGRLTAGARREAADEVAKARVQATGEAERIRAEAAEKAAGIVEQSRATLRGEYAQAQNERSGLAAGIADDLMHRAVGDLSAT